MQGNNVPSAGGRVIGNLLGITLPTTVATIVLLGLAVELGTRIAWEPLRGAPWFYLSHPIRREQLAPDYDGWFAGVPVRINHLGFRSDRDDEILRTPNTRRILVFGDSVTFGHGATYETTYPYLLESMLRSWKPELDWQVWNLGVPGYNTSQELAYLKEVGRTYDPDLVIVGFFDNDVFDRLPSTPTRLVVTIAKIKNLLKNGMYSYHFYKRAYFNFRAMISESPVYDQRLFNLDREANLLEHLTEVAQLADQRITSFERLEARDGMSVSCSEPRDPWGRDPEERIAYMDQLPWWHHAVESIQQLHKKGEHNVLFFLNIAPDVCSEDDLFFHGIYKHMNDYFTEVLGDGVPVVSSYYAFYYTKPSQMPEANGHARGNSNFVKAETLFRYLSTNGVDR